MKIRNQPLAVVAIACLLTAACSKEKISWLNDNSNPDNPIEQLIDKQVIYWGKDWVSYPGYQEILITSRLITDEAIAYGIDIKLAPYSNWDTFEPLPMNMMGTDITFEISSNTLRIISHTDSLFTYPSDVMIKFN
jgi:hypothetical protein